MSRKSKHNLFNAEITSEVFSQLTEKVEALNDNERDELERLCQTIEYVAIDDIVPSENKERDIRDGVPKVAGSIRKFGFRCPIFANSSDKKIVIGHTRWYAAKLLGLDKVPVVFISDLTQERIDLLRLVDNRVAEFTTWDFNGLGDEISSLSLNDDDYEDLGLVKPGSVDWDAVEDLDDDTYDEPEGKNCTCPKCGFVAGQSFFKPESSEDGKSDDDPETDDVVEPSDESAPEASSSETDQTTPETLLGDLQVRVDRLSDGDIAELGRLHQSIEYVDIESIRPSANSTRKIAKGIPKVAESIRELGFRSPIYVDGNNGDEIVVGHTRWFAARLLGLKKVPIVRINDLTPSKVRLFRIADNRVAEFSSWNFDALNEQLDKLSDSMPEIDMERLGLRKKVVLERDGNTHSSSSSSSGEKVLTCPKCGYSGPKSDFAPSKKDN